MAEAMEYANKKKNLETDINEDGAIDLDEDDRTSVCSKYQEQTEEDEHEPLTAKRNDTLTIEYMKHIRHKRKHSKGEQMYVSYWDFAGQSTYYSTHQVFMSQCAVYVLVVDLSEDLNKKLSDNLKFRTGVIKDCSVAESLKFWISSIKAFTSDSQGANAPVIIVGTHIDEIKANAVKNKMNPEEVINKKFDDIREILKMSEVECIAINNAEPNESDLNALRNRILELGLGVIDEEIPAQWIDLERKIQEYKRGKKTCTLTFGELKNLDKTMDIPIEDNTRLQAFLGHQHNRGHLIHFPHDSLQNMIILKPDLLAKFLNNIMRTRDNEDQKDMKKHISMHNHNGIINRNYVIETAKMLREYPGVEDIVDELLNMLVHLSVIRPYKFENNDTKYLLPCLLPDKPKENIRKECEQTKNFQVAFPHNHLPPTFYHILVGGLLNEWKPVEKAVEQPEIYNLYACFRLDKETHQMEIFWKDSSMYIDILSYSKNILTADQIFEILDIVEKRIHEIFLVYRHTNTNYEIRVRCPKHSNSFVSLSTLKRDGEAMCYHGSKTHAVGYEKIFNKKVLPDKPPEWYIKIPTDKYIGRLARFLVKENATSLATRLRLQHALVEADRAAQSNFDEDNRRLAILICWKRNNGSEILGDLVHLLMLTGEYQREKFDGLFTEFPNKGKYDLPDDKLDNIPDNKCDILA